ncbi:MAG: TonB-dependent receptor, partial [Gammaproteobacteria bacterium]|nr:TonB-dependent receptor [Gammaproteobacteria bacterium]
MSAYHFYQKTPLVLAIGIAIYSSAITAAEDATKLDEIIVEGETQSMPSTHYSSPSTSITEYEVEGINATTVEDFVKYEPSMVVRRRYIGDSNGVVGMRGANMFQTARVMVYAD